jgi:hypothetical protein
MAKIFISYKRNIDPDTPVARAVYDALSKEHEVFIDTTIQVGERWAEKIQQAIKESAYLISLPRLNRPTITARHLESQ